MRVGTDGFELSASDLANHLGCHHLTQLDLAVAAGNCQPPECDPGLAVLQQRGLELEQAYLDHVRQQGRRITELGLDEDGSALEHTISALRGGAEIIYQATSEAGTGMAGPISSSASIGRAGLTPGRMRCWTPSLPARPGWHRPAALPLFAHGRRYPGGPA